MSIITENVTSEIDLPNCADQEFESLLAKAECLLSTDADKALPIAQQAKRLAGQFSDMAHRMGLALVLEGRAYLELDAYEQAIPCFLHALESFNPGCDLTETANGLCGLGASFLAMESYPDALQNLLRAKTIYHSINDLHGDTAAANLIGRLYVILYDAHKALPYLEQALENARQMSDWQLEADILDNLCNACQAVGDHARAVQYGLHSAEIYQEKGYQPGEAQAFNSLGDVSMTTGELEEALNFLSITAEISERTGRKIEFADALRKIGVIHNQMGHSELALSTLQHSLDIARKSGSQRVAYECHRALSQAYKDSEDYRKALEHFEQFYQLQQAAFDSESDRRLKTIEIVHQVETTRKDAEISRLRTVELQREIDERKKAQQALEQLATQDSLTGLSNRRHFVHMANTALEQAIRYDRPLSAVMMDVDNFKHINDTFGHTAGDQILTSVANCMQRMLRKVDILGRFGGDEFVVLLPETSREGARRLSERLRLTISQRMEMIGGISLPVTVSIGLSSHVHADGDTLDMLLDQADKALYVSKQSGRNKVTVYDQGMNQNYLD